MLCSGCQPLDRCRLGIQGWQVDADAATITSHAVCGNENTGGPGIAHGGWTAAVLDDVLGRLPAGLGLSAVTANLSVRYVRPVPAGRTLVVQGRLDRRTGRRLYVVGDVALDGSVLATAAAEMAVVDQGHVDRHQAWLRARDAGQGR